MAVGSRPARGGVERALIAAAVGGGLGAVVWLVAVVVARSVSRSTTCQQQAWGCLGDAIAGFAVAVVVLAVLAWPLLRLAGVRPAWPVALVALPVAFILVHAYEAFGGILAGDTTGWILILAISYAAAAVLTEPGARPLRTVGLAALLIALYPAASARNGRQQADANAASLEATHLPLLAAELPGYRIAQAGAVNPGEWIGYRLVPDSAPPELTPSETSDQQDIYVVISHPSPLFAPPAHCASDTSFTTDLPAADGPPCQPAGHGLWTRPEGALVAVFTSYGHAVVELDANPAVIPVATVERAAEHLVPSSASAFPDSP
jgi:hypothetical protein